MKCKVCGIELVDSNHEHNRRTCFHCRYIQDKSSRLVYAKKRYIEKRDAIRKYQKQYVQTPTGKDACRKRNRKHKTKRERGLGWVPLNSEFLNSEGHHIDRTYVIFIPRSLHQSVRHNVFTGHSMNIINDKVYEWFIKYYELI